MKKQVVLMGAAAIIASSIAVGAELNLDKTVSVNPAVAKASLGHQLGTVMQDDCGGCGSCSGAGCSGCGGCGGCSGCGGCGSDAD